MKLRTYKALTLDVTRPVLFLDIDGVLNGGYQHERMFEAYQDAELLQRPSQRGDYVWGHLVRPLARLLNAYRAQVVVVSSWMSDHVGPGHPEVEELRALFDMDVVGSLHTGGGERRGQEVAECLQATRLKQWIILDDCDHFYDDERLAISRIVSTQGRYGLQPQDMEMLEMLLSSLTARYR